MDMGSWLQTPAVMSPFFLPGGFEDLAGLDGPTQLFMAVAEHSRRAILLCKPPEWRTSLPAIPCATGELKDFASKQFLRDGQAAIGQLADPGSVSAQIVSRLRLTRNVVIEALAECGSAASGVNLRPGLSREMIKQTVPRLRHGRPLRTILRSIACATRFKFSENAVLLPTVGRNGNCGRVDSFQHLLGCTGMRVPPRVAEEEDAEAYSVNPDYLAPQRIVEGGKRKLALIGGTSGGSPPAGKVISEFAEGVLD